MNPAKNATHVRVIMTAAEAGNTAKEAFVPRTVLVAALTAKATTSPIPAAVITVPVTAITVTDIVRLNVSTLVLRHPAMEIPMGEAPQEIPVVQQQSVVHALNYQTAE